jgi:hypothetical protein
MGEPVDILIIIKRLRAALQRVEVLIQQVVQVAVLLVIQVVEAVEA